MRISCLLLVRSMAILMALSVSSGGFARAETAFDRAYDLLLKGTPDDIARSTHELVTATDEGDLRAVYAIGTLLQFGIGVEQDQAKALDYYVYAADRGLPAAALSASDIYFFPRYTPDKRMNDALVNHARAIHYAWQAVSAGSADAMTHMANLQRLGIGVPKDEKKSLRFLHTAVELGDYDADTWLQRLYREGSIDASDMPTIVAKLTPLAEAGDTAAMVKLARILYSGWHGEREVARAEAFYRLAAEAGNAEAQFTLCLFGRRDGKPKDAYTWCLKAAEQNHVSAMLRLADIHIKGDGAARDLSAALHLSWSAAILGAPRGQRMVSHLYGLIARERREKLEAERRSRRNETILRFIGRVLTTPPPEKDPYLSQQWDRFQDNQRRLQRQVDELSAIGWSGL